MNLPLVLDVGIGLVFIYLTLSLVASEIQELLATLLQWRAKHLKQAIETLLSGANQTPTDSDPAFQQSIQSQIIQAQALANSLYNHSLIKSLNQEAKGMVGAVGQMISRMTKATQIFTGQSSGPSYLPSATFATTLLETLKTEELAFRLSELKLDKLIISKLLAPIQAVVADLRNGKANDELLERELQALEQGLKAISQGFSDREITLSSSFSQVVSAVKRFVTAAEAVLPEDDYLNNVFLKRLSAIEQEIPSLLRESGPGIVEVISELNNMSWVVQVLQQSGGDYRTLLNQLPNDRMRQRFRAGYAMLQTMNEAIKEASQGRENYQDILLQLSPYLQDSLLILAKRAQTKIVDLEQGAEQLQQEVSLWFDRTMDRTSGVYKRNAKGVALILGFFLAVSTNTDTLYVIMRLAKDPTIRSTYSQVASQLAGASPDTVGCLGSAQDRAAQDQCLSRGGVNESAAQLSRTIDQAANLPIGWTTGNLREQWPANSGLLGGVKIFLGWLISALAIGMGAPFWFGVLNKLINVRNSGRPPVSKTQASSEDP